MGQKQTETELRDVETSSLHQVQRQNWNCPAGCEHQHSDCDWQIHLNHSSFSAEHSSPLSVSLLWTSLAPDWRGEQRHKQPYNQVYASQTVCIYGIVSSLWSSHSTIYLCIKIHVMASCRLFPNLETGWEGVCVCVMSFRQDVFGVWSPGGTENQQDRA